MEKWNVIHDMDDEDGKPTCWALQINHSKYGKFVWITLWNDDSYHVEVDRDGIFVTLASCKSLRSAKRWVTMNLF